MKSLKLYPALVVFSCAVVLSACAKPPDKVPETERMLRDALQLPADVGLAYQDELGAPVSADQLAQRMKEGVRFVQQRDETTNTVTLRIEAAPQVLERLPDFDLARLDDQRVGNSHLAGAPALVNFFFEIVRMDVEQFDLVAGIKLFETFLTVENKR